MLPATMHPHPAVEEEEGVLNHQKKTPNNQNLKVTLTHFAICTNRLLGNLLFELYQGEGEGRGEGCLFFVRPNCA